MDSRKTVAARIVFGALMALLVVGLCQGYGWWLLGGVRAHGS